MRKIGIAIINNSSENHQKVKIELPYDPEIPLWGIYQKETKILTQKDICIPCTLNHL